jgi:hypothetical protein
MLCCPDLGLLLILDGVVDAEAIRVFDGRAVDGQSSSRYRAAAADCRWMKLPKTIVFGMSRCSTSGRGPMLQRVLVFIGSVVG